jgi:hypothetical protein
VHGSSNKVQPKAPHDANGADDPVRAYKSDQVRNAIQNQSRMIGGIV